MRRQTARFLLAAVIGLVLCGAGLGWQLLRSLDQAARLASTERLRAIGLTAARALAAGAGAQALLPALVLEHELEDAYVLDRLLRPTRRGGGTGRALALLRIDPDRALLALRGQASVGAAYRIEPPETLRPAGNATGATDIDEGEDLPEAPLGAEAQVAAAAARAPAPRGLTRDDILAGYFPVVDPAGAQVLILEAGAAFVAAPRRLRTVAWAAAAATAGLALLCLIAALLAVRAASRERLLYGQAQRGQAISLMAAMVAHEIRNPLSTIRAGAELLREQAQSPALADDILEEVERLTGLTGEFLALAQDAPLLLRQVDVAALCDEICDETRLRVRVLGAAARLEVRRTGEAGAEILADGDKLRQVLRNLALNAEQSLREGGTLEVQVSRAAGGVLIQFRDDGPGIDAQLSRRLFEPFATTKAGGTGLGLVLSRRIAERHGGTLTIEPTPANGRGACFALRLPRRPPDADLDTTDDLGKQHRQREQHGTDPAL